MVTHPSAWPKLLRFSDLTGTGVSNLVLPKNLGHNKTLQSLFCNTLHFMDHKTFYPNFTTLRCQSCSVFLSTMTTSPFCRLATRIQRRTTRIRRRAMLNPPPHPVMAAARSSILNHRRSRKLSALPHCRRHLKKKLVKPAT